MPAEAGICSFRRRTFRRSGMEYGATTVMQIRLMTPVGTSVLVVERDRPRAEATKRLLVEQGYSVTGLLTDISRFAEAVAQTTADAIMIYATEPDKDLLDALRALPTEQRRPTILITEDGSTDAIHQAVAAGVNACVVVGVNGNRIRSAIDLAKANFSNTRGLREELDEARNALRDRKVIERAKGIIMRERALDEDAAYTLLRTRAMQRGVRLVVVAEMVNEAAEVMQL
ncbi:MAG TPA: response regulator [Rhodospirillaceae bacterium]|nr:response regulator [Rhodospirillaceae bacterium]